MHELGHTRGALRRDHMVQTPDTFVRTPSPTLTGGSVIVHASPQGGAAFAQYTAEFDANGELAAVPGLHRLVYLLQGELTMGEATRLAPGSFLYVPPTGTECLRAPVPARAAVIELRASESDGGDPSSEPLLGDEAEVVAVPLLGDNDVEVRALLPEARRLPFAVATMTYQPGASLSIVEMHVMEHGLLMLEGKGIYRLGDAWYPVAAGDFIWMAPFCPQWFGALGRTPAKYLIYKDWNRPPLALPGDGGR